MLFGFNGNNNTKEVFIDYVRDEDGNNPDKTKPVSAVGDFTMNTDEYVEVIHIGKDVKYIDETSFFYCKELREITVDGNEFICDTTIADKKIQLNLEPGQAVAVKFE